MTAMSSGAKFDPVLLIAPTREGSAAARARGSEGGHPLSISAKKLAELHRIAKDSMDVQEAGELVGVSRSVACPPVEV
ncbi:hypothetical protein ACT17_28000 [Mycolicibacterium conceptionense]|uniref:Uncharacterized protein n=1 Tax=Mycolicibacterium conceptionense TaxID=451644 RepID=A0A0J8TZF5_9MYCO|nr:hypothetical protein ACT17_28000 [Mycolicibacterium conceptionense]